MTSDYLRRAPPPEGRLPPEKEPLERLPPENPDEYEPEGLEELPGLLNDDLLLVVEPLLVDEGVEGFLLTVVEPEER